MTALTDLLAKVVLDQAMREMYRGRYPEDVHPAFLEPDSDYAIRARRVAEAAAPLIEAHYATELDRARAEALEDAATDWEIEPMNNHAASRYLRARAATYRTDRKD